MHFYKFLNKIDLFFCKAKGLIQYIYLIIRI